MFVRTLWNRIWENYIEGLSLDGENRYLVQNKAILLFRVLYFCLLLCCIGYCIKREKQIGNTHYAFHNMVLLKVKQNPFYLLSFKNGIILQVFSLFFFFPLCVCVLQHLVRYPDYKLSTKKPAFLTAHCLAQGSTDSH